MRFWVHLSADLGSRLRATIAVSGLIVLTLLVATAAEAAIVSVPLDTVVKGNKGDIKPVRDPVSVSDLNAQVGWICDVAVVADNPGSEHPFNNLIVGSNGDQVVAVNVEEFSGKVTQATGTLTLGSTVTFDVLLGPDQVFSGGMDIEFQCSPTPPTPSTTTTTTEPLSTTTTTDSSGTTTTEVPPPTYIDSGSGGYIEEDVVRRGITPDWLEVSMWIAILGGAIWLGILTWRRHRQ